MVKTSGFKRHSPVGFPEGWEFELRIRWDEKNRASPTSHDKYYYRDGKRYRSVNAIKKKFPLFVCDKDAFENCWKEVYQMYVNEKREELESENVDTVEEVVSVVKVCCVCWDEKVVSFDCVVCDAGVICGGCKRGMLDASYALRLGDVCALPCPCCRTVAVR